MPHSVQVVTGVIDDDAHFSYVAEIDDEDIERTVIGEDGKETVIKDAWMGDPTCWKKANPNIGISVKVDYLERIGIDWPTRPPPNTTSPSAASPKT